MNDFYIIKGDVIRIPIKEWVYNYIRSVFEWESDRHGAYQATINYELSSIFINDYTGSFWSELYHRLDIDFAREIEYRPEFSNKHLDFLVNRYDENGIFILSPLGNIFSSNTAQYLRGIRLTEADVNKKFFIMTSGFSSRPTKEEHNNNIKAQIQELESRLVS